MAGALTPLDGSDGGGAADRACMQSWAYCGRCADYAGDDVSPDISDTGGVTKCLVKVNFYARLMFILIRFCFVCCDFLFAVSVDGLFPVLSLLYSF